ncbi:BTB/POZ domain-containing protein 16-like isoform X2 [Saccostrea echinata]|uniref:BTB/POZ domain-containing protein 16-like isoform X2 n=1 Tax=Saccostrea echinata TaxID=191078 RepID=UPI002A7F57D2|nr:BTB/POZ domain-containing protein 16-like isoform X2 [Saccostrea echinata]
MTESAQSYFPSIPPSAPKATISYCRSVQEAPFSALTGVVVDARIPERHPVTPRCRMRKNVGSTNRWRLPESLGSDLLGSSQAIKAVQMSYNNSLVNIITAESPVLNMNLDVSKPYTFRQIEDRPITEPERKLSQQRLSVDTLAVPTSAPSVKFRKIPTPLGPIKKYVPSIARPATPKDIFLYHSKKSQSQFGPDVILKCLNMDWELHRPFLQKAEVLASLLKEADDPRFQKYYRSPASETLDTYIKKNKFYSNDYKEMSNRLSLVEDPEEDEVKGVNHPAHVSEKRVNNVTIIKLDCKDPLITKTAMAVALGNLYHDDLEVELEEVANVLASASVLGFKALQDACGKMMLENINYRTVCIYHLAASKYHQEQVVLACERWLELNLIPQLSSQIQLRDVPMELIQKTLKSNRLFTFNEYSIYRLLSYWLFLQLNPHIQLMPSHSTVLSYYNSLPKNCALVEKDEGQMYAPLFSAVRLTGITDTNHIQDMQIMNILPQSQLIDLLSQHYHALQNGGDSPTANKDHFATLAKRQGFTMDSFLQGGGDMGSLRNFNAYSVRQGFIIDDEPHYHSEVLSLHGFHFELKAIRSSAGHVSFYMQRLRPGDPILSFRQCERHTFSMRPDREVRYCITVQQYNKGDNSVRTTGIVSQKFGLGDKTSRSECLKMEKLDCPVYVTFAVMFPSS